MNLSKKHIIFGGIIAFLALTSLTVAYFVERFSTENRSRASLTDVLNLVELYEGDVVKNQNVIKFSLYKEEGFLYKTVTEGKTGVDEFINKNPKVEDVSVQPDGTSTQADMNITRGETLLPDNLSGNQVNTRTVADSQDSFLARQGFSVDADHFFYDQMIANIPILGSSLAVHMRNGNEIYALDGILVRNQEVAPETISEDQAKTVALDAGQKEVATASTQLIIAETKRFVVNKAVLGTGEDTTNYPSIMVLVASPGIRTAFAKKYYINLNSGQIFLEQPLVRKTLQRSIHDASQCSNTPDPYSCLVVRNEGSLASANTDANSAYDFFGETYNLYFSSFGRDSYDNGGSLINGFVELSHFSCPSAFWSSYYQAMFFCDNMVAKDTVGHEITHGVTTSTANFMYESQSGALDESIADIFGSAMDNNWIIGEDSPLGIFRSMSDPPSVAPYGIASPDRLFSQHYFCPPPGEPCGYDNDNCGVHYNSGVLNKAYYVMTDGASFNGCTVSGIGRQASLAVVYRALTSYLTSTSNFKDMHDAIIRSCNDLYGANSNTCNQVIAAMQATEMDQQPVGLAIGASCIGQPRQTPQCAQSLPPQPTATPILGTPAPQPTSTFAPTPSQGGSSFTLLIDVSLQGISDGTQTPIHATKPITVELDTPDGQIVNGSSTIATYDQSTRTFKGSVSFAGIANGIYVLRLYSYGYLSKRVPGTIQVTGTDITIPKITLLAGDATIDNKLDIADYNILLACFGAKATSPSCQGKKDNADFTDDGVVDGIDYNIFVRNLSSRAGD